MYKVIYGEESCRKTEYFMTLPEAKQFATECKSNGIAVHYCGYNYRRWYNYNLDLISDALAMQIEDV